MTARNEPLIAGLREAILAHPDLAEVAGAPSAEPVAISGLSLEARALLIAGLQSRWSRRIALIVPSDSGLDDFAAALRLFSHRPGGIAVYPGPALSPYQEVPTPIAVVRDDLATLGRMTRDEIDLLLIPARAIFRRLPPPESIASRTRHLGVGDSIEPRDLLDFLVSEGYVRTDLVGEPGELAWRGGIIDLFPPDSIAPLRIELDGDAIDSIRRFDPETQRSEGDVDSIAIGPVTLFPVSTDMRQRVRRRLSTDFQDPMFRHDVARRIDRIDTLADLPELEHLAPLVCENVAFDAWLPTDEWTIVAVEPDETRAAIDKFDALLRNEYETDSDRGRAIWRPDEILVPAETIHAILDTASVAMNELQIARPGWKEIRLRAPSAKQYVNRLGELAPDLEARRAAGNSTVVVLSSRHGLERAERLLTEFSVAWSAEPPAIEPGVALTHGTIAHGFDLEERGISVLSEWDLFESPAGARAKRSRRHATDVFQTDLRDLRVGDTIVHIDHGIGRFRGLKRIEMDGVEHELVELEYHAGGKLLLPVDSLNLIQKYTGGGDAEPTLDRLGGTAWARTKASVKKALRDMADELLKLYAKRSLVDGHAFSKDSPWQLEFEESFEFDETEDQISAIEDAKRDMESRRPMDRLLCGDVGYGKTEVAMRAAFKAVLDGRQVALLAPTTILAYQHYRTMLRRFASFPVTIELLSRHWTPKEQKAIAARVAAGEIDILIGTHRILSKDVEFRDLGLLVVDEEQRFGVAQKERLKQLKTNVDVLAMSATPIPRTLHMSLAGIRDISVIETPPKDRLAIQTAVVPFNDELIREAIEFEIARDGQVFFVHNRIESIPAVKDYLERLIPGVRVVVGHGQMDERELERSMLAFIERKYDVLLATTIIENGIDIPACNTMLINHAERFGLSQLYQLRGRVGRSDRLAFCYLLVASEQSLSNESRQRLAAIQEFSDLGAGFRIAAKDLEIRGAGNLLGGQQSGHIAAVGFDMYTRLLEETIHEMKGEPVEHEEEASIRLGLEIHIPDGYIDDENLRMTFYKKIASARDEARLAAVRAEMEDRFGSPPASVETLLDFVKLRLYARSLGVVSITRAAESAAVRFRQDARIDPNRLFQLVERTPGARFSPAGVFSFRLDTRGTDIIGEIFAMLQSTALAA